MNDLNKNTRNNEKFTKDYKKIKQTALFPTMDTLKIHKQFDFRCGKKLSESISVIL